MRSLFARLHRAAPPALSRSHTWLLLLSGFAFGLALSSRNAPPKLVQAAPDDRENWHRQVVEATSYVFESVGREVAPAVVYLEAHRRDKDGKLASDETGSGVFVLPAGSDRPVVVTNMHVVADAQLADIDVYLADGRLVRPVRMYTDEQTDLAILDLNVPGVAVARFGSSESVRVGEWVLAIGSPFGLTQSLTHGIISAKHRRRVGLPGAMRIKEFLQTDAAINPGNSGGPLVSMTGEVIGINTAIASNSGSSSGVAFAIPVEVVRRVVDELATYGYVRRAYLGVEFPNYFTFDQARQLGLASARGALVAHVHDGTPAARAGLKSNDVILTFDGAPVEDENHLINVVSRTDPGRPVEVIVWRDRRRQVLSATLSSWDTVLTAVNPDDATKRNVSVK